MKSAAIVKLVIAISLCIALIAIRTSASPLALINKEGVCKSHNIIDKFLDSSIPQDSTLRSTLGVIDCSSTTSADCSLVNALFNSEFSTTTNGLNMDTSDDIVVLRGCYDEMISTKFCGSKLQDYFNSLGCPIIFLMKGRDLESTIDSHDQMFRRLFRHVSEASEGGKAIKHVAVVVESEKSLSEVSIQLNNKLSSMWMESGMKQSLSELIDLSIIVVRASEEESVTEAQNQIKLFIEKSAFAVDRASFASSLQSRWGQIPSLPRRVLSRPQQESLYIIEQAYASTCRDIDAAIVQLQKRVSSGKTLAQFSSRVEELLDSSLREFNGKVLGTSLVKDRAERIDDLRLRVINAAFDLFRQQVQLLEYETTNKFKNSLLKYFSAATLDKPPTGEDLQQLLRQVSFDHKALLGDLENEELGLIVSSESLSDFTAKLEAQMKAFPESPEAKLIELRRMEKEAMSQPSRKRRGKGKGGGLLSFLKVSMTLVGMLRPPGYGNLQGYLNYRAPALLGVPLDFLLGVQNDGDSPEIMGEDREHPILRLQPKFNFDIDLQ